MRVIKKYKNRRLYDTETSQYINMDSILVFVKEQIPFRVESCEDGADVTAQVLMQLLLDSHSQTTQFLSVPLLLSLIRMAHHPFNQTLHQNLLNMMQNMQNLMSGMNSSDAWLSQSQEWMNQWQDFFKGNGKS